MTHISALLSLSLISKDIFEFQERNVICVAKRQSSTRKFVAWGSTPRPGSRAASVTLDSPNKPFGSARTARAPRALELVAQGGGLSAAGRTN